MGQRFGADRPLLSTWPIATYCFLRGFETRGLAWSAGAGAAAALAMLGSHSSVFPIAGFVAAVLAHPGRRTYVRSASSWLAVAVGALVLAPPVQWLLATGCTSLSDLDAAHTGARITRLVAASRIVTRAAAPWLAQGWHAAGTREGRAYCRPVSAEMTNAWHLGTGLPLRIVMGDRDLASAVTFYSRGPRDAMPGFEIGAATPWITPERLAQDGWAAICNADDEQCVEAARQRAAGKSNVQFITYSTINRYLGKGGKLGRFFFHPRRA